MPIGDCAGCIKADLKRWESLCAGSGLAMVLLTTAPEGAARDFLVKNRLRSAIVSDRTGAMSRHLNAVWPGRPYLYSPTWRLLWRPRHVIVDDPWQDQQFARVLEGSPK